MARKEIERKKLLEEEANNLFQFPSPPILGSGLDSQILSEEKTVSSLLKILLSNPDPRIGGEGN